LQHFDFERFGTLRQVLLWYHQEKITIPLAGVGEGTQRTAWRLPKYQHLLRMLKKSNLRWGFRLWLGELTPDAWATRN